MSNIFDYLLARAGERSTWLGVVSLLTAVGITLQPAQVEAIIALAMAVAGAVSVFTEDKE